MRERHVHRSIARSFRRGVSELAGGEMPSFGVELGERLVQVSFIARCVEKPS